MRRGIIDRTYDWHPTFGVIYGPQLASISLDSRGISVAIEHQNHAVLPIGIIEFRIFGRLESRREYAASRVTYIHIVGYGRLACCCFGES